MFTCFSKTQPVNRLGSLPLLFLSESKPSLPMLWCIAEGAWGFGVPSQKAPPDQKNHGFVFNVWLGLLLCRLCLSAAKMPGRHFVQKLIAYVRGHTSTRNEKRTRA